LVPHWFLPSLDLILVYENCMVWTVMCGSYITCSRVLLLFNVVTHGCDLSSVSLETNTRGLHTSRLGILLPSVI